MTEQHATSSTAATASDAVGSIEQHGINVIPDAERKGKPRDLFFMWLGTNLNVFYVVNGAVIISMGLSFPQAVLAILIGNCAFFALGLTSQQGPKSGTSTFANSRASYGPNGSRILAGVAWLRGIGWTSSGLVLVISAVLTLLKQAGIEGPVVTVVVILASAVVQATLPIFGHATIHAVMKAMVYVSGVVFLVIAVMVAPKVQLGAISGQSADFATMTLAIALAIGGGGLSWSTAGSDYSRYLPKAVSSKDVFWWSSMGGMVAAVSLEILGAAVASVVPKVTDPMAFIPLALPGWIAVPYLIFAVVTLMTVGSMDMYSSGLNLQVLGIPVKRWHSVLISAIVGTFVCFLVVFNDAFSAYYIQFLILLNVWLAPWLAIYIVDWALRRQRYDVPSLFDLTPKGRYWGSGGFNVAGWVAQACGVVAALLWVNSSLVSGPISKATGGSDLSVPLGLLVGGLVYYVLAKRQIEADRG
ncbi:MAG TPA: cytosine permease [Propioniciclava tarda]|nr:cytosine permease [Propioniciclava tarda]HQA30654.1 cytosine permease [Propioniciclava tarda]HQD60888.1 cytosine permease [Propioniciclava tarda]